MKVLMRGGKPPHTVLSPEASLAAPPAGVFGSNSGNLLFSQSVHRVLSVPDAEVVVDSFHCERAGDPARLAAQLNEEYDAFVVPLANAFRPNFVGHMQRLTRLIEHLTIPVVVPGVGAQLGIEGDPTRETSVVNDAARAFVAATLERCASIGVRGEMTQHYLVWLGFPASAVDVIGCPSVFDGGPELAVRKKVETLNAHARIVVNTGLLVPGAGEFVARCAREFPKAVFVGQTDAELALLLWGTPITEIQPGLVSSAEHPLYRSDRLRFFVDPQVWIDDMRTRDFALGGRIHGNVAPLLAGTPAVPFAWDSRIRELSEYHAIPYRLAPELGGDIDVAALYDELDFSPFNDRVAENFARYVAFLDRNGLEHIHQSGKANPAYDERLAELSFPGPVGTPYGPDGTRQVLDRMAWLRQGPGVDQTRRVGAYVPSFGPAPKTPAQQVSTLRGELSQARDALTDARNDLSQTRQQSAAFEQRLRAQGRALDRHKARLNRQDARLASLEENPFPRRSILRLLRLLRWRR